AGVRPRLRNHEFSGKAVASRGLDPMPPAAECISCRRPKATLQCGLCEEPLCKSCDEFLAAGTFSFLEKIPSELTHTHYCSNCHRDHVEPALASYNETMDHARGVYIFFTTQRTQPPIVKKSSNGVRVEGCDDRDETILRLAFRA